MIAYHGSICINLTELKPFAKEGSTIVDPRVYLTTDKVHASLYIKKQVDEARNDTETTKEMLEFLNLFFMN